LWAKIADDVTNQYFAGRQLYVDLGDGTVAVVTLVDDSASDAQSSADSASDAQSSADAAVEPRTCKVLQSFTAPGACSRGAPSLFDIVAKQHGDVYQAARSAYAIP